MWIPYLPMEYLTGHDMALYNWFWQSCKTGVGNWFSQEGPQEKLGQLWRAAATAPPPHYSVSCHCHAYIPCSHRCCPTPPSPSQLPTFQHHPAPWQCPLPLLLMPHLLLPMLPMPWTGQWQPKGPLAVKCPRRVLDLFLKALCCCFIPPSCVMQFFCYSVPLFLPLWGQGDISVCPVVLWLLQGYFWLLLILTTCCHLSTSWCSETENSSFHF